MMIVTVILQTILQNILQKFDENTHDTCLEISMYKTDKNRETNVQKFNIKFNN